MAHGPPQARQQGLLCRDLPDGMMVYDEERHRAHSLNQTAALVWRHCDGKTGVSDLAHMLQRELKLPPDEEVVWMALDRLDRAHLLLDRLAKPAGVTSMSRRGVIRKLGLAGGLVALLPLVDSLTAPPAFAQGSAGGVVDCSQPAHLCQQCDTAPVKFCCPDSGNQNAMTCTPPQANTCKDNCGT